MGKKLNTFASKIKQGRQNTIILPIACSQVRAKLL